MTSGALAGLHVIDLTQEVAGPYATKLFADYGADVIKVEHPVAGDPARRAGPFPKDIPHAERSGLFLNLNTGKRGVTLDLDTASGAAILRRMVRDADILVESFRPGTLAGWGLDPVTLQALNPRLTVCSVSNFGQTGPYRDRSATELIFQAMSGFMYGCGDPEREPLWIPIRLAQHVAGAFAFITSLASEHAAALKGKGLRVDISIHEAMIELQDVMITANAYSGYVRPRLGYRRDSFHPSSIQPTKDGFVLVSAVTEREWQDLVRLMGRPDVLEDPRFRNGVTRREHADALDTEVFAPWLMAHTTEEAYRICQENRVSFAMVAAADAIMRSAQLSARGFFRTVDHPATGPLTYPGPPFPMSETPPGPASPAPLLGQHNAEVYGGLGYSAGEQLALRAAGVI